MISEQNMESSKPQLTTDVPVLTKAKSMAQSKVHDKLLNIVQEIQDSKPMSNPIKKAINLILSMLVIFLTTDVNKTITKNLICIMERYIEKCKRKNEMQLNKLIIIS